jgi:arginyl-tRNA synthetase
MADFVTYRDRILSRVHETVRRRYGTDPAFTAQQPPGVSMGDLGIPVAFPLAKELKRKPREPSEAS